MPRLSVTSPSFEHHHDGFGIGHQQPRLSWRFHVHDSDLQGWEQTSYELEISRKDQVETFVVDSSDSVLVPWPSSPLSSRERCSVRVRVTGRDASNTLEISDWSDWATAECALLKREEFIAKFIGSTDVQPEGPLRPVLFRKRFDLPSFGSKIPMARLYITAYGVYEAFVNGIRVGTDQMTPGWTSYSHRHNYQTYDVTDLLRPSENVIAVEVAEGWYAGRLGWAQQRNFYGKELGVFAQLEVRNQDGSESSTVVSDKTWKCGYGTLASSEIYDGEVCDDQQTPSGWDSDASFDDSDWLPTKVLPFTQAQLVASDAPPVKVTETIKPVEIFTSKSGKTILDFGQNLVGKLFISFLDKPKGHQVTFRHAEVMEDGELGTRPLRSAGATDTITSAGRLIKDWSPRHTFHGFRYVQVEGWSTTDDKVPLSPDAIVAHVMHTDMRRTGWFSCSEPLVNQLHGNTLWSMRGNFLSIPTDCPQRDERLGWTGDIQVFSPSANFLYDTSAMLAHWMEDVAAEQATFDGVPPFVVPNVLSSTRGDCSWGDFSQAVWDDVVILVPWALYRAFGDVEILKRQYSSMQMWIDKGLKRGPDGLWDDSFHQLGDWLDPSAPPDRPGEAKTDGTFVADAYLLRITKAMSEISSILEKQKDADRYAGDYTRLKKAFDDKYMTPNGLLAADTQTGLALAIVFNLFNNPKQAKTAADRLSRSVRLADFKVATGFAGTPIITHALSLVNLQNLAYRMLLEKQCPSWLYPITKGATTTWERWDSMLPDGSVNPGEMTSFNHYALGSIVNWLHEVVGGISPLDAGWKHVLVRPVPGGSLTWAEVKHVTPYGDLRCKWCISDGEFRLSLQVPPNSKATLVMPDKQASKILAQREEGITLGSGCYEFVCKHEPEQLKPRKIPIPFFKPVEDGFWFE